MKISLSKASPVLWFALGALVVGGTGTAYAANGGTFRIGQSNTATATTKLTNTKGTALKIISKASSPPISVGSNSTKVPYFNADKLDGLSSAALQRRISATCGFSSAIRAISSTGTVSCGPAIYTALVDSDGTFIRGTAGTTSAVVFSTGTYEVLFPVLDIRSCVFTANVTGTDQSNSNGFASAVRRSGKNQGVFVETADTTGVAANLPFSVTVVC